MIRDKSYRLVYVPESIVYNKGAENIRDFLIQRRRIYAGHIWLEKTRNYTVSTKGVFRIFRLIIEDMEFSFKWFLFTPAAIFLEFLGRGLGTYDYYIKGRKHSAWEIARSTKKLKD